MIKLIFKLFRKQFLELAFHSQTKPEYLAKTEFVFIDSNGKRYYRFSDDGDMPVERFAKIQEKLSLLSMGMNKRELETLLEWMDLSFNLKKPDWKAIGYAIQEMISRGKVIIHRELFLEMMGCLLIREDQKPDVWDNETEDQKIIQFKKDIASGGIADFFDKGRLKDYLPYLNGIKAELPELIAEQDRLFQIMNQKVREYISVLESSISET